MDLMLSNHGTEAVLRCCCGACKPGQGQVDLVGVKRCFTAALLPRTGIHREAWQQGEYKQKKEPCYEQI